MVLQPATTNKDDPIKYVWTRIYINQLNIRTDALMSVVTGVELEHDQFI